MIKQLLLIVLFLSCSAFGSIEVPTDKNNKRYKIIVVTQCNKVQAIIYKIGDETKLILPRFMTKELYKESSAVNRKHKNDALVILLKCNVQKPAINTEPIPEGSKIS